MGAGIHEVAVGPVHAGIIEPGHFRFQCHGESVLSLEIHLGYQHRGAEALLLRSSPARRLVIAESIAGDTAVGHALAYCMAMEGLSGASPPHAANVLRALALELERLANHIGDLGALSADIAYLPGASYFGRLRGNFLNLLMELSGNRYGRGLLAVGGVRLGVDAPTAKSFLERLARDEADFESVADLMFDTPSVLSRFERTGIVSEEAARDIGLVGPAARASGLSRDVRHDHPTGIYRNVHIPVTVVKTGDVMARALVRRLEVQRSLTFVQEQLRDLPHGPLAMKVETAVPNRIVVVLVEGWRGEIAHVAVTDPSGRLRGYKIVDPSFHNWFGLGLALRGNQISDFPLCNKSFNLSYAGHDL
jgi:Ni,Fe-hydrogenase III large subunit